jgi:hypothetical protein
MDGVTPVLLLGRKNVYMLHFFKRSFYHYVKLNKVLITNVVVRFHRIHEDQHQTRSQLDLFA